MTKSLTDGTGYLTDHEMYPFRIQMTIIQKQIKSRQIPIQLAVKHSWQVNDFHFIFLGIREQLISNERSTGRWRT
ncbi:hypothetical protein D3C74_424060 [compost metagenome]